MVRQDKKPFSKSYVDKQTSKWFFLVFIMHPLMTQITFISLTTAMFDLNTETPTPSSGVDPNHLIKIITTICVPVVFGLIALVGIFGNALVIIVVTTNAQMRSTTNMLILNLAVADLLFIILCVPSTATDYVLNSWPFGLVWCQTVQYLIYATSYVSIYTLILMSIDRFMAVVFPVSIFPTSFRAFQTLNFLRFLVVMFFFTFY